MTDRLYADHNATTPLLPEAFDAMRPFLAEPGNAASLHAHGRAARRAVDAARAHVAALAGAAPEEVIFTSGGTESIHLAVCGMAEAVPACDIVTTTTEHAAVASALARCERDGHRIRHVPVGADGLVDAGEWASSLAGPVRVASLLWINNETGVVQDVAALARAATQRNVRLHVDAVQVPLRSTIDMRSLGVDAVSLSAHKFGGPQGMGALVLARGVPLRPMLEGGGQEGGRRGGTVNVAGAVGMGEAARLARTRFTHTRARLTALTSRFEHVLLDACPDAVIHGEGAPRAPGTTAFSLPGRDAEVLLIALDLAGISVSSGAACTTGSVAPSHVLQAMGVPKGIARGALRVSFGPQNADSDPDRIVTALRRALND